MAKYKKLPVEIEAIQWSGLTGVDKNNLDEIKAFVGEENMHTELYTAAYEAGVAPPSVMLYIHTLEGQMLAMPKDYIIKGVNGEFYPCKPDIFDKTYQSSDINKRYEEMNEFKEICHPVVDYLNKNYHPHATVIITQTSAEIVEGIMAVPFEPID